MAGPSEVNIQISIVILAEKPSQALAYANALKYSVKKDGYFEIKDPLFTDETFITFGFGHLVELAEPGHYQVIITKSGKIGRLNLCLFFLIDTILK